MTDRNDAPEPRPDPRSRAALSRVAADRDAHLLAALGRGDHDALEALYGAWFGRALGLARAITRRDESFCLDVVQETFVRIIDRAPQLSRMATRDDLDCWMSAIVRSAAIDLLRRELRRAAREKTAARGEKGDSPECANDRAAWLREQIAALDAEDAGLLALRFGRGATLSDTARAAGVTLGAAYGRIRRVIARLTRTAEEHERE